MTLSQDTKRLLLQNFHGRHCEGEKSGHELRIAKQDVLGGFYFVRAPFSQWTLSRLESRPMWSAELGKKSELCLAIIAYERVRLREIIVVQCCVCGLIRA